jgi:monoamine oxidase
MIKFIKSFFSKNEVAVEPAPYKVEVAPTPATVVEVVPAVAEQAVQAVVESIAPAKKPAPKKPAAKKPRTPKAAK